MNGPKVQPILDSAQRAASSGDYALAESLLREVVRLQTESLGPKHPDLASTFNNLGVVCDRANKVMQAGHFYREALSIASASLDADDPLVVTSRNNFDEFHRGLGLTTIPMPSEPPPQRAIVTGIAIGIVLLGVVAISLTRAPAERLWAQERREVQERLSEFGDPLLPARPWRRPQGSDPSRQPASETIVERAKPTTDVALARTTISSPPDVHAQLLEASLCQSVSTTDGRWECTPTPGPVTGNVLYFYTRVASSTNTRIHHLWYLNGTLRQDVGLLIHANPSGGYRTYSQRRVEPGEWRIAVVDAGGKILREQNVTVPHE